MCVCKVCKCPCKCPLFKRTDRWLMIRNKSMGSNLMSAKENQMCKETR